MNFCRLYFLLTAVILSLYHAFLVRLYDAETRMMFEKWGIPPDGSQSSQLSLIHLGLFLLLVLMPATQFFKLKIEKYANFFAAVGILAIYVWWFLEKYSFLTIVQGLRQGSADYENWLAEIGYLRGAMPADYFAFFLTVPIIIYAFLNFFHTEPSLAKSD